MYERLNKCDCIDCIIMSISLIIQTIKKRIRVCHSLLFVSDMLSFSTFPTFILKCVLITDRYERLNKYDCIVIIFYNYMYIILLHLQIMTCLCCLTVAR